MSTGAFIKLKNIRFPLLGSGQKSLGTSMGTPGTRMSPITARVPPFSTVFQTSLATERAMPQEVQTDRGPPRTRRLRTSIPGEFALSPLPPPGSVAASSAVFHGGGRRLHDSRSTMFMSPAIVSAMSAELGVRTGASESVLVRAALTLRTSVAAHTCFGDRLLRSSSLRILAACMSTHWKRCVTVTRFQLRIVVQPCFPACFSMAHSCIIIHASYINHRAPFVWRCWHSVVLWG
jgi:hypothetical protein